jgi:21S rRNA (GM2251-2'-O)-methyltransferase
VKTACKVIRDIQKSEAKGKDTSDLVNMIVAVLQSVNRHVTSGKFQDEPSEAVASLFEKKAAEGTFVDISNAASANSSVLFQRGDGKIEFAAKRQDSGVAHSRTSTKSEVAAKFKDDFTNFAKEKSDPSTSRGRDSRNAREEDDGIPISVPYTTAASEFLYGSNVVFAALKAQRRKLYNLYVHPNIIARESGSSAGQSSKSRYAKPEHEFTALARNANVPFRNEYKAFLLDKMSDGRPHNGVVLEASKLPAPPILSLAKPDDRRSIVPLVLGPQSAEEIAVNGGQDTIPTMTNSWRHPLVIMLDGILDPVNVGSIMRTCHFYGADAVAIATNTCAPLASAVLAKVSSGACEAVNILSLPQPANFVRDSAKAGWKVYAAVAPESSKPIRDAKRRLTTATIAEASPLANHPCILMLGAEGEGLRENLKTKADAFVSIERGPNNARDVGVDSMNVGVATGVLLEAFLRKPADAPAKRDTTSELGF